MADTLFKFRVNNVLKSLILKNIVMKDASFNLVDIDGAQYVPAIPADDTDLNLPNALWIKTVSSAEYELYYGEILILKFDPTNGNLVNEEVIPVERGGTGVDTVAEIKTLLELAEGAFLNAGTGDNELVQLDNDGKLPAVDGSQLTNIITVPTGSIIWHAASAPPTGFVKANGAVVSRTTYAALFAVIGTTYGVGDGSTTFALPDLRGEFVRGLDDGRGIDADRTLGSAQADANKAHTHYLSVQSEVGSNGLGNEVPLSSNTGYSNNQDYILGGVAGTPNRYISGSSGSTEARPRNIALLACIKT